MERFDHDDEGYLRWIDAHPSGLVINCLSKPSTDYLVLHLSTCPSITVRQVDKKHWTHDYIKVCAEERGEMLVWCYEEAGGAPTPCQICDPLAPA
jgi:hypothetical protein